MIELLDLTFNDRPLLIIDNINGIKLKNNDKIDIIKIDKNSLNEIIKYANREFDFLMGLKENGLLGKLLFENDLNLITKYEKIKSEKNNIVSIFDNHRFFDENKPLFMVIDTIDSYITKKELNQIHYCISRFKNIKNGKVVAFGSNDLSNDLINILSEYFEVVYASEILDIKKLSLNKLVGELQ